MINAIFPFEYMRFRSLQWTLEQAKRVFKLYYEFMQKDSQNTERMYYHPRYSHIYTDIEPRVSESASLLDNCKENWATIRLTF